MTQLPYGASVALIRGGTVLLIERAYAPYAGAWTLPGGRLEPGESAEACAIREVREELGIKVQGLRPVLTMPIGVRGEQKLAVFVTESIAGEIVPSDEVSAWRWLRPEAIAGLRTTPDLAMVLERAFLLFGGRE